MSRFRLIGAVLLAALVACFSGAASPLPLRAAPGPGEDPPVAETAQSTSQSSQEKPPASSKYASPQSSQSGQSSQAPAQTPSQTPPAGQTTIFQTYGEGQVKVFARNQEKTQDRIYAVGDVEIHYKDIRVFADRVEVNPDTKDVLAEGNVVIRFPSEVVTAERVFFNLDTDRGTLEKAYGMIQPTIFYQADSVEKKDSTLYHLIKARLTSCTQPTPRWDFSVARADLRKDDYVEMWHAVFRIKNVPVFYLPYMRYPVGRDRATGFLIPQLGFNSIKGTTMSQGFYWAIARNLDATINADYYSKRGAGAGLEFRYLFGGGTGGQANIYTFAFKRDSLGNKPDDAYIIRLQHNQPLPFGFSLVANVDYQSSFDFLREFDNNFRRAVISNRSSQVYLSRAWGSVNLSARMSRFETYFQQIGNSVVYQYLPQVSLNVFKVKLLSPVYFSLASSFESWQYGWQTEYKAGTQRKSSNLKLSPMLSVPFTAIPWLTLDSSATLNFIYYGQSYLPNTQIVGNEPIFTRNLVLNFNLVGPVIFKIWHDKDGEPWLKHIIEPNLIYSYDTRLSDLVTNRIVTTYGYFFRYHQLTYGLANRFLIKSNGMPREIVTVGLSGTYFFNPEQSYLAPYKVNGKIPSFSEISGYIRFYPGTKYSLDFGAGYNPYYKNLTSIRLGASLGQIQDKAFLILNWYKSMNSWYEKMYPGYQDLWNRHQISAFGGLKIPKLSVDFLGDIDFNVQEKKLLYTAASAVYHYQCLDFTFEVKVFYFRAKPETQFKFSFGLGNIGKTTDFLGGFGYEK